MHIFNTLLMQWLAYNFDAIAIDPPRLPCDSHSTHAGRATVELQSRRSCNNCVIIHTTCRYARAPDLRGGGGSFNSTFFERSFLNLWTSIHCCRSYHKNKSGPTFLRHAVYDCLPLLLNRRTFWFWSFPEYSIY